MTEQALHVLWSDDGQHIRKWSCEPFEGSTPFVRTPDLSATSTEEREALALADEYAAKRDWNGAYHAMQAARLAAQPSAPQVQVSGVPRGFTELVGLVAYVTGLPEELRWTREFTRYVSGRFDEIAAMLATSPSPAQQDGEVERLREALTRIEGAKLGEYCVTDADHRRGFYALQHEARAALTDQPRSGEAKAGNCGAPRGT